MSGVSLDRAFYTAACFRRPTTPYLPCLHNHLSNPPASSPFGTSPLADFHLVEAPKFLWPAGFLIKFLTFCVSGLSSPFANYSRFVSPLRKNARSSLVAMSDAHLEGVIVKPSNRGTTMEFLLEDLK